MTIVIIIAAAVAGFVAGVLVGRANKKTVEHVVSEAKAIEAKAENIFKK